MVARVVDVATRGQIHRQPGVHGANNRVDETIGHDAGDRIWPAIHRQRAPDGRRRTAESVTPQRITDDHGRGTRLLLSLQRSPEARLSADDVEIVGADRQRSDATHIGTRADVGAGLIVCAEGGDGSERCHPFPVVEEVNGRDVAAHVGLLDGREVQANQLARLLVRQRLQEHRIHGTEHRRRPANADGQREDGDGGESRAPGERPDRIGGIAHAVVQQSRPARVAHVFLHAFDAAERKRASPT